MNSLSVVVLVAALAAVANAGLLAAPIAYAVPAIHPHHVVAPLALPHPVSYAAPATIVKQLALPVYAAPVVKTVYAAPVKTVYAAPVVKTLYSAPVVKAYAPAPVFLGAPVHHHHH